MKKCPRQPLQDHTNKYILKKLEKLSAHRGAHLLISKILIFTGIESVNAVNKTFSTATESCEDYQYSSNVQRCSSKVTEFNIILSIAKHSNREPCVHCDSMLCELSNTFKIHKENKKSPTSLLFSKRK